MLAPLTDESGVTTPVALGRAAGRSDCQQDFPHIRSQVGEAVSYRLKQVLGQGPKSAPIAAAVLSAHPSSESGVHASNESNVEGWVREAALVWSLTDTFDIPVHLRNTDYEKTEVDRITPKGQKWKEQSAANAQGTLDGVGHDKPE
jgi:hypothetical protein